MARPPPSTRRTAAATPDGAAIAEAALRVLHEGGPHALSFRRVAALLSTSHMTVHRHCHNVDGLLDLCADHLAATLPEIDPALPWGVSTERRFTGLYDLMSANSSLVALQRGRPWLSPAMMSRFAEPALAASLAAGLTLDEMIRSHRTFYMFTVGCALTRDTYDVVRDRGALDELDPGLTPVLAASRDRIEVEHEPRDDYVRGLRTLIAAADPSGVGAGSADE